MTTPSSEKFPEVPGRKSVLKSCSIATSFISKSNINYMKIGWNNGFAAGAGLRAEANLGDYFAFGLRGQYDISAYVQTDLYFRWIFVSREKIDFYTHLGGCVTFGAGRNEGQLTGLLEAGIGNDLSVTNKFSVFEEIAVQWSIKNPGFEVAGSLGTKYTF